MKAHKNFLAKKCIALDLAIMDYSQARELQLKLVEAKNNNIFFQDIVLFLEHPAVFTVGRRGNTKNLLVSKSFLEQHKISLIHIERGGDITYHGPGQIVVYPILDLHSAKLSVTEYVHNLEEVMIRTANNFDVSAIRSSINRGVWVNRKKLGSIGITVRKGICFHGIAFNVNLSLEPFTWIKPCGLDEIEMTTLAQESSRSINIQEVVQIMKRHFESVFQIEMSPSTLTQVLSCIGTNNYAQFNTKLS